MSTNPPEDLDKVLEGMALISNIKDAKVACADFIGCSIGDKDLLRSVIRAHCAIFRVVESSLIALIDNKKETPNGKEQ